MIRIEPSEVVYSYEYSQNNTLNMRHQYSPMYKTMQTAELSTYITFRGHYILYGDTSDMSSELKMSYDMLPTYILIGYKFNRTQRRRYIHFI